MQLAGIALVFWPRLEAADASALAKLSLNS